MNTSISKKEMLLHRKATATHGKRERPFALTELFLWITVFTACGYLLTHPSLPSEAVKASLSFCARTLIPSLFPFMISGELLVTSRFPYVLEKYLGKPFYRVFGIDGKGAAAFVIGAFCGFPVGAKTAVSLYLSGNIKKEDAERLSGISNNAGLGFLVSGIGIGIWGSAVFGAAIYTTQLLSAFLTALFLFGISKKRSSEAAILNMEKSPTKRDITLSEALSNAISSSALSMLRVVGFVVFFEILISSLSYALSSAGAGPLTVSIISAFAEITAGAKSLNQLSAIHSVTYLYAAKILTFTLSAWGGLSVYMQFCAFACPAGLSTKVYLKAKLLQSFLSTLIGSALVFLKIV